MTVRLVVDISNLLFRVAAAQVANGVNNKDPEEGAALALHVSLNTLKKWYTKLQPDQMALAFEGQRNWRKDYTKSEACVSKRLYKGNRIKDPTMEIFITLIQSFKELVENHTSIFTLQDPILEGDDLIGGYAKRFGSIGDTVYILSGDKDFIQLYRYPGVVIVNPDETAKNNDRSIDKHGNAIDPHFFIFEKCFRGDIGDNVLSAYPRVRSSKLRTAFDGCAVTMSNLLNHSWTYVDPETGDERTLLVKDMVTENKILMDLDAQPEHIKVQIEAALDRCLSSHGAFDFVKWNRFLGEWKLKKLAERSSDFIDMFSKTGISSGLKPPANSKTESAIDLIRKRSKEKAGLKTFSF